MLIHLNVSVYRPPLLCVYGSTGCILHQRHQHSGWYKWSRSWPVTYHFWLDCDIQCCGSFRFCAQSIEPFIFVVLDGAVLCNITGVVALQPVSTFV